MVQTVSVLSMNAEDRVQSQAGPCNDIVEPDWFCHCDYDSRNAPFVIDGTSSSI
jgi:hypothetical protein